MKNTYLSTKLKTNFRGIQQSTLKSHERKACLNISIDQKNEQGDKLAAIIDKANRSFGHFDLMLCDSLNRFNLIIERGLSMREAEIEANNMGDEWIEKNQKYINSLHIPGRIIRWDEWRIHDNFQNIHQKLAHLVHTDEECMEVFSQVAHSYFERKQLAVDERSFALSIDYLIEECAIIVLWAIAGYHYELYPSTRSPVSAYTLEHFAKNILRTKLYFLRIEFKKSTLPESYEQQEYKHQFSAIAE